MLSRVRIVLVRPIRSGNVGAVARVMENMELRELVLVAPECDPTDAQGMGFAARAKSLLHGARTCATIPEALADCVLAIATSAKGGMYRKQAGVAPEEAADLAIAGAARGPVAVVFGPEDRGLLQHELVHFDRVLEIPSNPAYAALNLASAAAIVCYELRRAALRAATPQAADAEPRASGDRKEILFEKLFDALDRIGFFRTQQSPEPLRLALRRILGRAELRENEADILIGMAQQIRWYHEHHPPVDETRSES